MHADGVEQQGASEIRGSITLRIALWTGGAAVALYMIWNVLLSSSALSETADFTTAKSRTSGLNYSVGTS